MWRVMALLSKGNKGTDYLCMTHPDTFQWCEEYIGSMNYDFSGHRNYHYFVVSEEEYQSYWKDKVS